MSILGTFKSIVFNKGKSKVKKKFNQSMVSFITFALLVSPGLGVEDERAPSCRGEDFPFCTSSCSYVLNKCNGDKECSLEVCSYLYPICYPQLNCPRFLQTCWDSVIGFSDTYLPNENKNTVKKSILNKNFAYLLLKLHPLLNQTSQYGFLSSGRMRRITANYGNEFLGKRSNNKPKDSRTSGNPEDPNKQKPKPKFYSLPLNKFSQAKILKRAGDLFYVDPLEKRNRGNGRVTVGSEFLGKRGRSYRDDVIRRSLGNEFLGKRNLEVFEGSEFLGKRGGSLPPGGTEFLGKKNNDVATGTELLGKKSNRNPIPYYLRKRYGNELLGKRNIGNEFLGKRDRGINTQNDGIWTEDDPELIDEALYNYRTFPNQQTDGNLLANECTKGNCEQQKSKDAGEQQQVTDSD